MIFSRLRRKWRLYIAARDNICYSWKTLGWNSNHLVLFIRVVALLLTYIASMVLSNPPIEVDSVFATTFLLGYVDVMRLDDRILLPWMLELSFDE